jgi:predicted SprT family Zn-dependent metalloprotease
MRRITKTGEAEISLAHCVQTIRHGEKAVSTSTLMEHSTEALRSSLQRLTRTWNASDLLIDVKLRFSSRLKRSLGRANARSGTVSLSPMLRLYPASLDQALTHELAHILAFRLVGRAEPPHGATWRALMMQAGYAPTVKMTLDEDGAAVSLSRDRYASTRAGAFAGKPRYRHRCSACNLTRIAGRRMPVWRCARCLDVGLDGLLVIESIQARGMNVREGTPG